MNDELFVGDMVSENNLMVKFPGGSKILYRSVTVPLLENRVTYVSRARGCGDAGVRARVNRMKKTPTRFTESLGFIKKMMKEDAYKTKNGKKFEEEYVVKSRKNKYKLAKKLMVNKKGFAIKNPYLPNPTTSGFYDAFYASVKLIYEIEIILEQIEYDGLTLNRAKSLFSICALLSVTSTDTLISLDNDFSFSKKYSVAQDIYIMASNIQETVMFVYSVASESGTVSPDEPLTLTDYDELESRLCCKYIRNGITGLKLFHILALLEVSPAYDGELHQIADVLIQKLREVLFNKRIIKIVVDSDLYGRNDKSHKSTRLKIYFAMGNSDRYCIRLDFPHDGEECIHLNLNEPTHKQSTGFPFAEEEYQSTIKICKGKEVFDQLFYYYDDLYWFRSCFAANVKKIGKNCKEQEVALEQFHHDRSHIAISSSDKEDLDSVREFSMAFAEAMFEYKLPGNYASTDTEDDGYYQLVLFQDYIFDTVLKIKYYVLESRIRVGDYKLSSEKDIYELDKLETDIKALFCKYIKKYLPQDTELLGYASQQDLKLCDFFDKCLDYLDNVGV